MSEIRKKNPPCAAANYLKNIPHHGLLGTWTEFQYRKQYQIVCYRVCVCVCVFIKLHITAQSGLVILVILCHSH